MVNLAVAYGNFLFDEESRVLMGETCRGNIVSKTIDFEVDQKGKPLKVGDIPYKLPDGVKVKGKRSRRSEVPPTKEDAVIFDTSKPGLVKSLASSTEGKVLIISMENGTYKVNP